MGGSLDRLAAVSRNTFREILRERVLYNLVFFAILMGLLVMLQAYVFPGTIPVL